MNNNLYYTKKAKAFEEALPLGNGRIGAMVFGNLKKERIALNEDTLWSGLPIDKNKKDAYEYLDEIRDAIFKGDHKRATEISNRDMHGVWSECYLPFGDLIIDYKKSHSTDYSRTLDISKGIATVSDSEITQTAFVSYPAQLLVINIKSDFGASFKVKFDSQMNHNVYTEEDTLVIEGRAPEVCYPRYYFHETPITHGENGISFCGAVKVIGNADFEKKCISVKEQNEITLLVSIATSFIDYKSLPVADAKKKAFSHFENIKSFEKLKREHISDFSALFDRVDIDLGTEKSELTTDKRLKEFQNAPEKDSNLVALLFQYARYLTISCSRKGSTAMNLQGIFNEHMRAPWSSNYTTNINIEMNYWCTDICNLSECFEPFVSQTFNMVENGKTTAKDYYNCGGSCAHHNSDLWAMTQPAGDPNGKANAESYAPWPSALPWMLNQIFEHYRYTKDEELFNEMKPRFKEVLDFYNDFLVEFEGNPVTCPSISPENTYIDNGTKACLSYMPTMDIGILEEFFKNCREFGFETPEVQAIPIGSDGRINEWAKEYEEREKTHRHLSHLYCVYPSAVPQSEEVKKACEKSLIERGFDGTGWALGWKVCLWAKLKNPENAMILIKNQLRPIKPNTPNNEHGGSYPNLFDAHPPFQIDGNFGVAAGIAELFRQNSVPEEWTGYVKGLKLYGGKTLNLEFESGEVTSRTEE